MDSVATALVLMMLSGVLALIAWPLLRPDLQPLTSDRGPASQLAHLEERKHTIYGAIRDLGLDFRTDKLTEGDYRSEVDHLKAEAVGVLAEIERLRAAPPRGPDEIEDRIAAARAGGSAASDPGASAFCTSCGKSAAADDRFCGGCGAALPGR